MQLFVHFGDGHYKTGHIPSIQSLITFEQVKQFEQNELFCKPLIEMQQTLKYIHHV